MWWLMMNDKSNKRPVKSLHGAFQRRMMRRIALILITVFTLFVVLAGGYIQVRGRESVQERANFALSTLADRIARDIADPADVMARMAISVPMRDYARLVHLTPVENYTTADRDIQARLLRELDSLILSHSERYLRIRYFTRTGLLHAEVKNFGGVTRINTEVREIDLLDDPAYTATYVNQAGKAYASPIRTESEFGMPIIDLFAPVGILGLNSQVVGTLQLTISAEPVLNMITEAVNDPITQESKRRFLLFDADHNLMAASGDGEVDSSILDAVRDLGPGFQHKNTSFSTRLSSATIPGFLGAGTPWRIVIVDDLTATLSEVNVNTAIAVIVAFAVLVVVLVILNELLRPLLRPLVEVQSMVQRMAGGELTVREIPADHADEFDQLIGAMGTISGSMQELRHSLEAQVRRYNRDMDVVARIGREMAALHDLNTLLSRSINLICDELGYYHAQVFLVDDVGMNAVLSSSRGAAGQRMLEQGYKVAISPDTVIGAAITGREPVVVNDTTRRTTTSNLHRLNPLLAETRSEIGLPLFAGDRVIGVLDIHSREPEAFRAEDLPALKLLSDQLAIAVYNAQLVSQTDQRIQQIDRLNRQLTRTAWEEAHQRLRLERRYNYNLLELETSEIQAEMPSEALTSSITVRGEIIGTLSAEPMRGQEFTEGDRVILQAVAERVALAIENARLFQETQITLAETSTLYQLSRYLNEANTLEDIIQAIIVSVMPDATGGQVWMFDEYHTGQQPTVMTLLADLATAERDETRQKRLHLPDYPFLQTLRGDQITLVKHVEKDARLDDGMRQHFRQLNAQAVVLIPLSVRGVWRGVIMMEYAEPREFSEREGRIFVALIDQAGVAIDNRLLLQQTEEEVARNENLYASSRIINTAQNMQDLVYAAVATARDQSLNFSLSLLEGRLDETGWPTRARMLARSEAGVVHEVNATYTLSIPRTSPLRQREPHIVVDDGGSAQASSLVSFIREQGNRYAAIFPLFSANQPIALFQITAAEPKELLPSDYEAYRALTGQMSSQIQIRQLLERTEEALDETRRLYVASSAIAAAQDASAVYQAAVEHLARPFFTFQMVSTESGQVLEISILLASPNPSPDAPYLETALSWHSESGAQDRSAFGQRVSQDDLPLGRLTAGVDGAIVLSDVYHPERDDILAQEPQLAAFLQQHEVASMVASPIKTRRYWYGAVICYSNHEGAFGQQYIRFASAIADQVAIAADRQRLFEEARHEAERAQAEARRALALAEAGQLASRVGDNFDKSLGEVFERVGEAAGFDRWMLLTLDDTRRRLDKVIARVPGFNSEAPYGYDLSAETPVLGIPVVDVLQLDRGLLVNDLAHYPSFVMHDDGRSDQIMEFFGKHIAMPVRMGGRPVGSLFVGRSLDAEDVDERDEQLVQTLAAQVAVAYENRQLFQTIQNEQRTLSSILATLPVGVLVLDAQTLKPITFNEQVQTYLRREVDPTVPFSIEDYNLYRTGTQIYYPKDELPIFAALRDGEAKSSDDIAIIFEDTQIDLLVDAAPIVNERNQVTAIVAAFADISNLRSLENTLQENLRETVQLYEAQRQLTEAVSLDDVLDALIMQLAMIQPADAYILLVDENATIQIVRELNQPIGPADALVETLDAYNLVRIADVETSELSEATRTILRETNIRSLLTVPMRAATRDKTLGWMMLVSDLMGDFPETQEPLLNQLSDMASVAIDNRYLIQTQQATLREIQSLYSANSAISSSRDLEQLTQALYEAFAALEPDYFGGFLDSTAGLQPGTTELFNYIADGLNPVDFAGLLIEYDLPPDGLYIDDLQMLNHPDATEQQLIAAGLRGIAAIHVRPKDMPSGFLVVAYEKPHRFTEGEHRYLNTLADSASIILNNIILFDQIQQALEETSILYQASRALADATTPRDIVDVVVNYLVAPHVHQVFIALLNTSSWETANATVQIVASWGEDEGVDLEGVTLSSEQFPAWRQISSPAVLTIDDIYSAGDLDPMEQVGIESLDTRSLVIVPLRVTKRAIGAVWIGSREPHTHTDREIRSYQAFAEQASLSLEAAFLFQQTERRARQLETSSEVSRTASTILDLQVLMPRLVDLIKDAFGYDHVQIFLMDEKDEFAELRASTGEPGAQLLAIKHKLRKGSASVIGQVTARGEPTIALDTADAAVVHQPNPYLPLTRSEMALPLIIKGRVVGALDVQSNQPNAFNEEDVRALTTLAGQIAVAIDNANLYESAQSQASNMSFLFEVSSAAAAAQTLDDALHIVARRLYEDLKTLSVAVYLPRLYADDRGNMFTTLKAVALAGSEQPLSEIEEIRTDDESKLVSVVSRNLQPFVIDNVSNEPRYLPVMSEARSAVILPLTSVNELIGLIVLEDERTNAFGYDRLQILLTLTRSLSAIVQSSLLLERLTRTNEQLRELDRLKSDFLANMSHELRTPLNSIIGFSRVMLKGIDGPLTEMQEQDLTTIYNSGQHLLMLINDLLDQAKIAAGKLDIKLAYFEMKPLVEAVKSIGVGLVKDKNITLTAEVAPNLPKAYGDEFRTRQVLINLVSNAAKFTNLGAITIHVYLTRQDDTGKQMIRIDVADTGIGIAEKDMPLLFEAFRQVDSSLTRTVGGTGLGLPIAKSLVEMQGGEMFVKSEVNVGSTFSFTVPIEPVQEEKSEALEPIIEDDIDTVTQVTHVTQIDHDTRPTNDKPDGYNTRPVTKPTIEVRSLTPAAAPTPATKVIQVKRQILLIEDNKDMVDQFRRILQREGFDVQTADHPAYTEAMASNLRPNVIVMDVNFAGGEGWNILSRLKDRDDTFDIPIIVVSLSDESERAYQMGVHHFIQRPFLPEQLVQAVLDAEKESNTERILIIDDHPEAIRLLTQLLNENGTYRVFSAESGVEGISMVARRRPDLIILDLRMPEMDGFAVLQELRSNPETATIPVMVVTGELNLKADERELLSNVRVLHKTDISQEEYEQFIADVRRHLREEK